MEQQTALREFYVDELRAICNCHAGTHLTLTLPKTAQSHETENLLPRVTTTPRRRSPKE